VRLWSVHPRYLDRQGLTACWREGLLAQKVLTGTTRGYRNHPQLERFRVDPPAQEPPWPPGAPITTSLHGVVDEAVARGYAYDRGKVLGPPDDTLQLPVTTGQLRHEWRHLQEKLRVRSPEVHARWRDVDVPEPHPLLVAVPGPVASWEVLPDVAVGG
jgi:hypothetical protein